MDAFSPEVGYTFPYPLARTASSAEELTCKLVQACLTDTKVRELLKGWVYACYLSDCREVAIKDAYARQPMQEVELLPERDSFGFYRKKGEQKLVLQDPALAVYFYHYNIHIAMQQEQRVEGFTVMLNQQRGPYKTGSKWELMADTDVDESVSWHRTYEMRAPSFSRNTLHMCGMWVPPEAVSCLKKISLPDTLKKCYELLPSVPFPYCLDLLEQMVILSVAPMHTIKTWNVSLNVFDEVWNIPVYLVLSTNHRKYISPFPLFKGIAKRIPRISIRG